MEILPSISVRRDLEDQDGHNVPFHGVNDAVLQAQPRRPFPLPIPTQRLIVKAGELAQFIRPVTENDVFPELILLNRLGRQLAADLSDVMMLSDMPHGQLQPNLLNLISQRILETPFISSGAGLLGVFL
jgi:hypothetical protein